MPFTWLFSAKLSLISFLIKFIYSFIWIMYVSSCERVPLYFQKIFSYEQTKGFCKWIRLANDRCKMICFLHRFLQTIWNKNVVNSSLHKFKLMILFNPSVMKGLKRLDEGFLIFQMFIKLYFRLSCKTFEVDYFFRVGEPPEASKLVDSNLL